MEKHGFHLSASCGGTASYTKPVDHDGKQAYIAVTDEYDAGVPSSLDQPVRVGIYDVTTGEEMEPVRDINSLHTYLESLGE
jgi:hypothetical protein